MFVYTSVRACVRSYIHTYIHWLNPHIDAYKNKSQLRIQIYTHTHSQSSCTNLAAWRINTSLVNSHIPSPPRRRKTGVENTAKKNPDRKIVFFTKENIESQISFLTIAKIPEKSSRRLCCVDADRRTTCRSVTAEGRSENRCLCPF